jgi:hypothetical protein
MTPEGWTLGSLFLGGAILTGNVGALAIGAATGTAVGVVHFKYHAREMANTLQYVESRLEEAGLEEEERTHLEGLKRATLARLQTLQWGSGCIGAATLLCPIAGLAYLAADVYFKEKARASAKQRLDEVFG